MNDDAQVFERRAAMAAEQAKRAQTPDLKRSWEKVARNWRNLAQPARDDRLQ